MTQAARNPVRRFCRRVQILTKLGGSILRAKITRSRRLIFLGLYITNRCNLRCEYCFVNVEDRFNDKKRWGFSTDEVFKVVDETYRMGTRWIFLLGGEPLMHDGLGPIVDHIVKKGILLHILTNGTQIEEKIDLIKSADGVCVSIDGAEVATDKMRGKGTFKRALHGVEVAKAHGMRTRIHAVLSKPSLGDMEGLAQLAKDMGVTITISPPNYLLGCDYQGTSGNPDLMLSVEEYKDFYKRYADLKKQGFPIGNSLYSIKKALEWPIDYHKYIQVGEKFNTYKPIPCVMGHYHGCIDAEGTMFNCIQKGCLDGLNINEVGIQRAWDDLPGRRLDCVSCASVNTIETAAYTTLQREIIKDGFKFFFGRLK